MNQQLVAFELAAKPGSPLLEAQNMSILSKFIKSSLPTVLLGLFRHPLPTLVYFLMLLIPHHMQVTLVSHYGEKPDTLVDFIRHCQDQLARELLSAFRPYDIEQVHATIIGLEGRRLGNHIINTNFLERLSQLRLMQPNTVLEFLRSDRFRPIPIKIGGYHPNKDYGFTSGGEYPYVRSFSIQGAIAVAMGWPIDSENSLDEFRRCFNALNVWHKWHKTNDDIDNDFFFVLGRIDRRYTSKEKIAQTESTMRNFLAEHQPVTVTLDRSSTTIVGYLDPQLPPNTSCAFSVVDSGIDGEGLLNLYSI